MDVVVCWNCAGGVACCPTVWLAVLDADALAMSWSNCISTGWLRCVSSIPGPPPSYEGGGPGLVSRALRISLKKRSGFSTRRCASFSGRSSAIAIKISSHSFGMRAGLPSCIRWMMATALFSHSVRAHSSLVRCAKVELRGGHCCYAGVPNVRKKGLSGAEGRGRVVMTATHLLMSLALMS